MLRRLVILAATTSALSAGLAAPAAAAPGNGSGQATFPMTCAGRAVTLTIGAGTWSAAYVHETRGRFVPKATVFSITDLATGEVMFEEVDAKPSAFRKPSTECVDVAVEDGLLVRFAVVGRLR